VTEPANALPGLVDGLGPANAAADWLIADGLAPPVGTAVDVIEATEVDGPTARAGNTSAPGGFVDTWKPEREAQHHDITWTVRPFDKAEAETFSGLHGSIIERRQTAHDGPATPWDSPVITARQSPVLSWDEGVELSTLPGSFVL